MNKLKWIVVPESIDDETGEPTGWSAVINHDYYGKYIWISKMDDDEYVVEVNPGCWGMEFKEPITCKSLTSAKRWVANKFGGTI